MKQGDWPCPICQSAGPGHLYVIRLLGRRPSVFAGDMPLAEPITVSEPCPNDRNFR